MFRVDRIRAVRATGEHFEPESRTDDESRDVYRPRADDPRVTLELAPAAAWVAEATRPNRPRGHGRLLEVVLAVSEPAWLERLLLALGPDARVVAPADLVTLGADAAARLRLRYEES